MRLIILLTLLLLSLSCITAAPARTSRTRLSITEAIDAETATQTATTTETAIEIGSGKSKKAPKTFVAPPFLAGGGPPPLTTATMTQTATETAIEVGTGKNDHSPKTFVVPPLLAGAPPPTTTTEPPPSETETETEPTSTETFVLPPFGAGELPPLPAGVPHGQSPADRSDCLSAHNVVRKNVSTLSPKHVTPPPLAYNTNLEYAACRWAYYLATTYQFKHSYGAVGKYGENLYKLSWPSARPLQQGPQLGSCAPAVKAWAAEVRYYKPGYRIAIDGNFEAYGHYTQLVWPTTLQVGCCGWQSPDRKQFVWACEYTPQGNYYGVAAY
ncbi:hypothetical protein HDV00_003661 [Rhizophlyctis rosea]|nr:hypothetical protein HDV00_003661 [Rhizophlyctis rosea]